MFRALRTLDQIKVPEIKVTEGYWLTPSKKDRQIKDSRAVKMGKRGYKRDGAAGFMFRTETNVDIF